MTRTHERPSGEIRIGCAGWSLPKAYADAFPSGGSHLERYANLFPAVEINSSFYRPHKPATYARWAASVPEKFRFSVKFPKAATHERRLVGVDDVLDGFLSEAIQLGDRLGPLLVQLPPSLRYSAGIAENFFNAIRKRFNGDVAFEPRYGSWFSPPVQDLLTEYRIARVAADPAVVPEAAIPGGWNGLDYYRLHGSPKTYYSAYSEEHLRVLAETLIRTPASRVWCIFDNTAMGAATANALTLLDSLIKT